MKPIRAALTVREQLAQTLLKLDYVIVQQVEALKSKGLSSPYFESFVVAWVNPLRFRPKDADPLSFDEALDYMNKAAAILNPDKIKIDDLAKSGGAPDDAG